MSYGSCSACDRDRRIVGHLFPGLGPDVLDRVLCELHDSPELARGVN